MSDDLTKVDGILTFSSKITSAPIGLEGSSLNIMGLATRTPALWAIVAMPTYEGLVIVPLA